MARRVAQRKIGKEDEEKLEKARTQARGEKEEQNQWGERGGGENSTFQSFSIILLLFSHFLFFQENAFYCLTSFLSLLLNCCLAMDAKQAISLAAVFFFGALLSAVSSLRTPAACFCCCCMHTSIPHSPSSAFFLSSFPLSETHTHTTITHANTLSGDCPCLALAHAAPRRQKQKQKRKEWSAAGSSSHQPASLSPSPCLNRFLPPSLPHSLCSCCPSVSRDDLTYFKSCWIYLHLQMDIFSWLIFISIHRRKGWLLSVFIPRSSLLPSLSSFFVPSLCQLHHTHYFYSIRHAVLLRLFGQPSLHPSLLLL